MAELTNSGHAVDLASIVTGYEGMNDRELMTDHPEMTGEITEELTMIGTELETLNQEAIGEKTNTKVLPTGVAIVIESKTEVGQIGQLTSTSQGRLTVIMTEAMIEGINLEVGIPMTEIEGRLRTEKEGL
jgi:2,3-bisphosphoglycerate-independent phosphoglycerate mutase